MTYTESQIRSLCGYYPDLFVYKTNALFIVIKHPLFYESNYLVWFTSISNKRYKIQSFADNFMFTNKKISCEYSMLSSFKPQSIDYDYTFNYQPNNLNEYLKYFHQQLPLLEQEYKKFQMNENLNKIKRDFV